mmetsp:Transcript_70430/g.223153  ORF Transcript_70430/g.223153 Transcript_70430/m.223153 type:complete len:981 (-) Transcript_70430:53-2995(-)
MGFISPLVGLLVACIAGGVHSLHEDQAGLKDWHLKNVGRARVAAFHKKRMYVATERNAVAALKTRTGELIWRQIYEDGDDLDAMVETARQVISLSGGGKYLRSWNPADGVLVWEEACYTSAPDPSGKPQTFPDDVNMITVGDLDGDNEDDVAILVRGIVQVRTGAGGEVIWNAEVDGKVDGATFQTIHKVGKEIVALGTVDDEGTPGLAAIRLTLDSGDVVLASSVRTSSAPVLPVVLAPDHKAVALDAAGATLSVMSFGKKSASIKETSMASLAPGAKGARLTADALGDLVLAAAADRTLLISTADATPAVSKEIPGAAAVTPARSTKGGLVVGVVAIGDAGGSFTVLSEEGGAVLQETFPLKSADVGVATSAWLNEYERKDGTMGYRALVVAEDHSMTLVQQGSVVWTREEGLAAVVDTHIVDLPTPSEATAAEEAKLDAKKSIWDVIDGQLLNIKSRFKWATPEEMVEMVERKRRSGEKLKLSRDTYGFRKLIVALSSSGKLYGIHNGDGRVLWSHFYRAGAGGPLPTQIIVSREPHSLDPNDHIELLVLGTAKGAATTRVSWVNAHTGVENAAEELPYSVRLARRLQHFDSAGRALVMTVDAAHTVRVLPSTAEAAAIVEGVRGDTHFFLVDRPGNAIRGYGLAPPTTAGEWAADELWNVAFPKSTERILATAQQPAFDAVNTHVKTLGDRSVMFMYINPNTLFVATGEPPRPEERANPDSSVKAYIIDTVTGRVLYRVAHQHATGPVHAVFADNWVVYHYWNVLANRHEMSVLELYDDHASKHEQSPASAMVAAVFGSANQTAPISSHAPPPLRVMGQSYFFGMSVKAMGVTTTARGITGKAVLLGTINDMVLMMDKRFLDPRRPVAPTREDMEEGLMKYHEVLPLVPHQFVTYGNQVAQLRGITTAPARLESTCLMLAYGLDLFYAVTTPARTFDLLDEDFSYALLVLTIGGLAVAAFVTGDMVRRQELAKKWR